MNGLNSDNLSLVLHGKNDLRLEQTPLPEKLKASEVLLQTKCCGICGSDLHLWTEGYLSDLVVSEPYAIGHESSAIVVAVGENVKNLEIGDRVTVEPAIPCLKCEFCRQGKYNICSITNLRIRGVPPMNGCLRRYYSHSSQFCFKLPENVSLEEGAMCEPLAVVVHAVRRVQLNVGMNVLVCGSGTIGLMSLLCAKAFGAKKVFITDVSKSRLELAKELGADNTYLIDPKNFNELELAKRIENDMGDKPDISLECTGIDSSLSLAIYSTKNGGKVAMIGLGNSKSNIPAVFASMREIDLIGIILYRDDFPLALHLISSGKVNLKPLITDRFNIKDAINAFQHMKKRNEGTLKVMINYD